MDSPSGPPHNPIQGLVCSFINIFAIVDPWSFPECNRQPFLLLTYAARWRDLPGGHDSGPGSGHDEQRPSPTIACCISPLVSISSPVPQEAARASRCPTLRREEPTRSPPMALSDTLALFSELSEWEKATRKEVTEHTTLMDNPEKRESFGSACTCGAFHR
ncbi:hypothetical protein [Streptomyces sp. NPDC056549]|uniref:hypothetical protein n=1 Tax=Streptomyces sp. NPDC056549 TaxID=3345864 RepID=UPI003684091C